MDIEYFKEYMEIIRMHKNKIIKVEGNELWHKGEEGEGRMKSGDVNDNFLEFIITLAPCLNFIHQNYFKKELPIFL